MVVTAAAKRIPFRALALISGILILRDVEQTPGG
jgi:hypothetical protein